MFDKTVLRSSFLALGLTAVAAFGQKPSAPANGVLHFTTNIGSLKLFNGDGTVTLHFHGTVLIRGYKGTPVVAGKIQKEYDSHDRQSYFGDGTFTFDGHFDSIQWFGSDLVGLWNGRGGFRLYGDYDKDLKTGWFWFGEDVANKTAWPTQSGNYYLPPKALQQQTPVLKGKGSG